MSVPFGQTSVKVCILFWKGQPWETPTQNEVSKSLMMDSRAFFSTKRGDKLSSIVSVKCGSCSRRFWHHLHLAVGQGCDVKPRTRTAADLARGLKDHLDIVRLLWEMLNNTILGH